MNSKLIIFLTFVISMSVFSCGANTGVQKFKDRKANFEILIPGIPTVSEEIVEGVYMGAFFQYRIDSNNFYRIRYFYKPFSNQEFEKGLEAWQPGIIYVRKKTFEANGLSGLHYVTFDLQSGDTATQYRLINTPAASYILEVKLGSEKQKTILDADKFLNSFKLLH